jgi:2'-5' RNA ligase
MIANQSTYKLFFALWPDAATRLALQQLQQGLAGRLTPPDKLHLTLAFLGQQPAAALPLLLDILRDTPVPPLRLQFDCYGYFSKPRIAWAGMRQAPPALFALQAALMARLQAAGLSAATHGQFRPHITLAREAKAAPTQDVGAAVSWEIAALALVESVPASGRYQPLGLAEAQA